MIQKILISIILGAGLTACSSYLASDITSKTTVVDATGEKDSWVINYVQPYKDSLDADMGKVIAFAPTSLVVERPSGTLNNWFADAVLSHMTKTVRFSDPVFCLFNTGGLRANINEGAVTLGDIFKVMPFDNMLVYVRIPKTVLPEIEAYLKKSGGEPIANAKLVDGNFVLDADNLESDYVILITSDYLAAGGDKMNFMSKRTELIETGILLRDALIQIALEQGTLSIDRTNRIQF